MNHRFARTRVDALDAEARLSELLDRVETGEVIVITRHGSPVATLQRHIEVVDSERVQRAIDGMLDQRSEVLASGPGLSLEEIRSSISTGRR
jgi:antitoxin (DNA-binding transcriptional repressor) of toxin-antitoxin stability system